MTLCTVRRQPVFVALAVASLLVACGAETPRAQVEKGKAELAQKDPRAAVVRFKAALQAEPDAPTTRALLGRALVESGDPRGAIVELTKALDQRAEPAEVMPLLARALNESGQQKKLIELHGATKLANPKANAAFKVQLAVAYAGTHQQAKADAALLEALAAVPGDVGATLLQTRFLLFESQFDRALAAADQLIARDARLVPAWQIKGEALLGSTPPNREGGEAALRKALELDAGYVPAHAALVVSRVQVGDYPGGGKQLAALRAVAPGNPETIFLTAQMAYFEKNYLKAREVLQQLMKRNIDNPNLLQLAAAIEWQGGSLVIAQKMLETALREDPTLDRARVNLAQVNLRLGQGARAMSTLAPALKSPAPSADALAAAGEAALAMGDPVAAEGYYRRAIDAAPDDVKNKTALAMAQLARGSAADAFASLEALSPSSKDGSVDGAIASARLARSDYAGALVAADRMVAKSGGAAGAHELRGRILSAKGDNAEARRAFEAALAADPRALGAALAVGEMDIADGKPELFLARYAALIKAEPGNHVAMTAFAPLRLTAGAPPAEVQASLTDAIKLAPLDPQPRLTLIELLNSRRQTKAALTAAQEAAASLPSDLRVLDALGRMLWVNNNGQQALSTFNRLLAIDPGLAVVHTRIADIHLAEGNSSAATASYRRALEIDPRLKEVRSQLINSLVAAKRSKEALELAIDMQRREPKQAVGYLLEGALHRRLLNHAQSVIAYRRGMQKASDPDELPLNLLVALLADKKWKEAESFALDWLAKHPADGAVIYNLGEGYMMNGEFANAEKYFRRASELRPEFIPAVNNLASMLTKQGKPEAVEVARRALKLAPAEPTVMDTLAGALVVAGNLPEALKLQQAAAEKAPGNAEIMLNLGKIALKVGDQQLARRQFERVQSMNDAGGTKEEAKRLLKTL